jgi:demethoxyubiquinone hydroxylase (CLK1/Coq7/Cat5 family)
MVSSRLLRRVALVRTDVSEEPGASFIRVTKIGELGTTQAVTSNRRTLRQRTSRATRRNIPEDTILHSHRRENLKSYKQ